ncbi:glycosyl hydrolase family 5 [Lysinibacillus sp. NPDC097287]|uniref:glycosyl hydrolase family 5 n=1 Tax=Lysinibacillus sp. NPDC097287 TaxID=3364144 RepID=UPI003810DD47
MFDKEALKDFLQPVDKWAKDHNIPANRIIAEEFGINRMEKGADQYLSDLISVFDEYSWHWAFYTFREDSWEGMDYQLGEQPSKWKYWEALEKGELTNREQVEVDNPLWDALKNGLEK